MDFLRLISVFDWFKLGKKNRRSLDFGRRRRRRQRQRRWQRRRQRRWQRQRWLRRSGGLRGRRQRAAVGGLLLVAVDDDLNGRLDDGHEPVANLEQDDGLVDVRSLQSLPMARSPLVDNLEIETCCVRSIGSWTRHPKSLEIP